MIVINIDKTRKVDKVGLNFQLTYGQIYSNNGYQLFGNFEHSILLQKSPSVTEKNDYFVLQQRADLQIAPSRNLFSSFALTWVCYYARTFEIILHTFTWIIRILHECEVGIENSDRGPPFDITWPAV